MPTGTAESDTRKAALPGSGNNVPNNPFDPARYRLSTNYQTNIGVKKVITNVPCRKPHRQEFVRVRPGDEWCMETMIFEDKVLRESYLVDPNVADELAGEIFPVCLYLAVNRQKDIFIWQVKVPDPNGNTNAWNDSAAQAAKLAQAKWVRVASNMAGGYYDVFEATVGLSEPEWPDLTFDKILEVCFRDHVVRDENHIVLKRLRGEV
jgi:hypothetical protein